MHPEKKVDAHGNYLEFPGVTVIAEAGNANQEFWQQIHRFLNQTEAIRLYYAPLPCESYHMTTNHLYTKYELSENWPIFLTQNHDFFQRLHAKIGAMPFTPTPIIERINATHALQLNLRLPPSQYMLIKTIANEFGIDHKIPAQFHITLAYAYRRMCNVHIINDEITQLALLCLNKNLTLCPPKMCIFHDMLQFISWDGKTNPFES